MGRTLAGRTVPRKTAPPWSADDIVTFISLERDSKCSDFRHRNERRNYARAVSHAARRGAVSRGWWWYGFKRQFETQPGPGTSSRRISISDHQGLSSIVAQA
jgi:hypothetical protein